MLELKENSMAEPTEVSAASIELKAAQELNAKLSKDLNYANDRLYYVQYELTGAIKKQVQILEAEVAYLRELLKQANVEPVKDPFQ